MLLRASSLTAEPLFEVLPFDTEGRGIIAHIDRRRTIVTLYMPNGGKDYAAKIDFYGGLVAFAERAREAGRELWICGDMNVAHTDRDIHPRDLPKADIGVRPDERACFDRLLETGLVDVFRRRHPEADDLFTWWPYWRGMREKNRGWRIDYHLGSAGFGEVGELLVHREATGSDHAPVLAEVFADA
jgi:exodeoxyribonuclease-3